MEHKAFIKITLKTIFTILLAIIGIVGLGIGMCLTMVFEKFILGIVIGMGAIITTLCTIPVYKGFK